MKRIISVLIISCLFLSGCGGASGSTISEVTTKFEDLEQAYDEAAPSVAKADDASVKLYEEAGEVYQSAGDAIDAKFDGYSEKNLKSLLNKMDEQIRVLESLTHVPEKKTAKKDKEKSKKKTYSMRLQNDTETPFNTVLLKSGSGDYDLTMAISDVFAPGTELKVALQAPQNEKYTVIVTDTLDKEITFGGSFYLSDKAVIELLYEEGKYKTDIISEAEQAENAPAETENAEQTTEQTAE